jgi:hypothetical protein
MSNTYDALVIGGGHNDLAEFTDTLEPFSVGRRSRGGGVATVHDSGAEHELLADPRARTRGAVRRSGRFFEIAVELVDGVYAVEALVQARRAES